MNTDERSSSQEIYGTALFGADRTKIAERIGEAERGIVARARSLLHDQGNVSAERSALDAALYALSVLTIYIHVPRYDRPGIASGKNVSRSL
jgi:hypothetical protein